MLSKSMRRFPPRVYWVRMASVKATSIPPAYQEYKKMMADSKKKYPGLYPTEKEDIKIQQSLINAAWEPKTLEANCKTFNDAYQNLWDNWGLDKMAFGRYERAPRMLKEYLKTLDYEYLATVKPSPVAMEAEDWNMMDRKMALAGEMVAELEQSFSNSREGLTDAQNAVLDIQQDRIKKRMKDWVARVQYDEDTDKTWSGLPFDSEMMNQVLMDIKSEKVQRAGDWNSLTSPQKDQRMKEVVDETWATMYDKVIKYTQPDRTKAEFDELKRVYFSTLKPDDISLGVIKDLSKMLFLQAYWNGGEKLVMEIDQQCKDLRQLYEEMPADYTELWKEALKVQPNLTMAAEVGLFIKALDVGFVPKILNQLRKEHAGANFVRSAHQVILKCHEDDYRIRLKWFDANMASLPNLEEEKKKLREQMFEFADKVDDIVFRQEVIKKEVKHLQDVTDARRDMPLPTMEEMLAELVNEALWVLPDDPRQAKIDAFTKKLLAYMSSGKGDMTALEKEAKSLFPSTLVSDANPITDQEFSRTFTTFIRGQRRRMDLWSYKDAIWAECNKYQAKIDLKRSIVLGHMKGKYHDVLCRLVKHLVEEGNIKDFETVLEHYGKIVKRHKGEVYGSIVTPAEMSDAQFDEIVQILQKQNPGKKYFLKKEVDPNLLAGFIIKCGADKLDYALSSEQTTLKKSLNVIS